MIIIVKERKDMNKEKKKDFIEIILVVIFVIASLLMLTGVAKGGPYRTGEKISRISTGWYYMDGDEKVYVQLPERIVQESGEELILYNDEIAGKYNGKVLTLRGAKYQLQIKIGEQILYQYEDNGFARNEQMQSKLDCDASLPEKAGNEPLTLIFQKEGNGVYDIPEVYVGTAEAVFFYHLRNEFFTIAVVLVILALSMIALVISVCMRRIKMIDKRFEDIGCFLILCGIWCLTDSAMAQTMSGMSPLVCYISFYAFMLFGIPMLHFLKNTGDMKKYRILDVCKWAFYINAIAQSLLCYFKILRFIDMLFVTHVLLIVSIAIGAALLVKEYKDNPKSEILLIIFSFGMLSAGGVLAIILYWLFEVPYYEMIYEGGIVVFIVLILCGVITGDVNNLRFKTEMEVYQRLSKEDGLTGFRNRCAFEEDLVEMEKEICGYDNAALIFMSINRLKEINDTYGHGAGDELIIVAARCIQNAFAGIGKCYRIDGDEFCVVMINPKGKPEDWCGCLDREILKYNKESRYHLSIAKGYSLLKDERGKVKTISDWKYEADRRMYTDKGWYRKEKQTGE